MSNVDTPSPNLKRNEITTKSILKKESNEISSPTNEEGDKSVQFQSQFKNDVGTWSNEVWATTECLNKCDLFSIFTGNMNINNLSVGNDVNTLIASLEASNKTDKNIVTLLGNLMQDFGLPAYAFLPTSSGKASVGKKCAIWSKAQESKVEIRIRTGAELRRLRFNWEDVLILQIGPRIVDFLEDQDNDEAYEDGNDNNSVQSKSITEKKRFISCEVRGKGYVDLFFASAQLATAVYHGWLEIIRDYKAKAKLNDK